MGNHRRRFRHCVARAAAAVLAVLWVAGPAAARVAPRSEDQRQLEADAVVYEAARAYFPSDDTTLPPRRIFRLTRDQIDLTVAALLPGLAPRPVKAAMPRDPLQTNYEYAELIGLNAANWGPLSGWIADIAKAAAKSPERVVACGKTTAASCHEAKARAFVIEAFRGGAPAAKVEKLARHYVDGLKTGGPGQAAGELVEIVLNSPDFLFRRELSIDATGLLAPAEQLEALAYTLADVPPAKLGLESAGAAKYLATAADRAALAERIVTSPEARAKLVRFFKAWLEIREPGEYAISREAFPEFTPEVATAMTRATEAFLEAALTQPRPSLKDITQAGKAVVPPALAPIYAIPAAWTDAARPVAVDAGQRLGIFSQPAVIASHSGPDSTRLVKRGVFWVRKVMCMELEPPPPGLSKTLYGTTTTTERARIEKATAPRDCVGCHKKIDRFGFFQEPWDAIGRWRALDNNFPIDAKIAIDFLDEEPVETSGPVEALRALTGSMMLKQCFVRQLYRYYMGRNEEPGDDPLLRRMLLAFAQKDEQDLLGLLRVLATDERLVRRR
ncbi:MAG: DUF1588 domain-containing protein [Hyphomicrobiaceae bacterium]